MGIRIHKAMGYAWDKVSRPDTILEWINDHDHITVEEFLCNSDKEVLKSIYRVDSLNHEEHWMHAQIDLNPAIYSVKVLENSITSYIKFDPESGLENVLLFIPLGSDDWSRYDDVIDYHECSVYHPNNTGEPRLMKLFSDAVAVDQFGSRRNGIFPYLYRLPPITIAALCVYMGIPNVFAQLEEAIYTWWG